MEEGEEEGKGPHSTLLKQVRHRNSNSTMVVHHRSSSNSTMALHHHSSSNSSISTRVSRRSSSTITRGNQIRISR